MSKSGYIEELEKVLLNQIEMLNEEGILDDPDEVKAAVEKSKAISSLVSNFTDIQRMKIEAVKVAIQGDGLYDKYIGIE